MNRGNLRSNLPLLVRAAAAQLACTLLMPAVVHAADAAPLPNAHAHNDYAHKRPLADALDHGFCNVEADIFLVDGALLVAHNRRDVKPEKTLEALYLDPLLARVRANGGRVYRDGPPFMLLVDIKADGRHAYEVLAERLANYAEMLTVVRAGEAHPGAITVVISGDRATDRIAADKVRYAGIDGRMSDLDSDTPANLMPLVSDAWGSHFKWRGQGEMPAEEKQKLQTFVEKAHAHGRKIRFWAIPSNRAVWTELSDAGVDLINTDDLPGLEKFLRERAAAK
ncbi:MAG TPA: phosphatidylinositol-specific phospholipase C/glycerophosphodiester phosphodiesterase family protein [Pirellulales bacterium]|nr:phosphatidylinositol-specific phospholipase C/glycerophosphodiester phosphodiesterase family protein [Pirellulales bacterium]